VLAALQTRQLPSTDMRRRLSFALFELQVAGARHIMSA